MGLPRGAPCSKAHFWDGLLERCMPCGLTCHAPTFRGCADFCRSTDCRKRAGFYYDQLLRDCIDCSAVCGQHPKECDPSCRRDRDPLAAPRVAKQDAPATAMPAPSALAGSPCRLFPICDPGMFVYIGLGLCLCTLLLALLMWVYFRKRGGEEAASHKKGDHPKDCLAEEGRSPEPIETCGFCFPEVSPAVQETKACDAKGGQDAAQAGAADTGTLPTPEETHFPIICCPSQERMPMA